MQKTATVGVLFVADESRISEPSCSLQYYIKIILLCAFERWETLDSFMQHDVQELCRVVSGFTNTRYHSLGRITEFTWARESSTEFEQ